MKNILIQLPDGLKPKFSDFYKEYKKNNNEILIWAGSNFGACDIPSIKIKDLTLINVGHNNFPPRI